MANTKTALFTILQSVLYSAF